MDLDEDVFRRVNVNLKEAGPVQRTVQKHQKALNGGWTNGGRMKWVGTIRGKMNGNRMNKETPLGGRMNGGKMNGGGANDEQWEKRE